MVARDHYITHRWNLDLRKNRIMDQRNLKARSKKGGRVGHIVKIGVEVFMQRREE